MNISFEEKIRWDICHAYNVETTPVSFLKSYACETKHTENLNENAEKSLFSSNENWKHDFIRYLHVWLPGDAPSFQLSWSRHSRGKNRCYSWEKDL